MNSRLKTFAMTSAALLLGLSWSGISLAQQAAPAMPAPELDRASCTEVDWHLDMVRDYPWVATGCHEAIVIDGQKWARFEGVFEQLNRDGTITSNFRNDRGRSLGNVILKPSADQRVLLDGRPARFSDLRRGQVLNFYAPEGMYAFTTKPGAPADEVVQIVAPRPVVAAPVRMARAEPATTTRPASLPATAGPLPIVALGGLLSLLGGIGLTMRRRFHTPNA